MVINNILDELFSTWSNVVVLRALINYSIGISGREVARAAGLTPKNCLITLTSLEQLGVVIRIRGGREHIFSLNRTNYLVQNIIQPVFESEKKFKQAIFSEIKKSFSKITLSVILFGSVARNMESTESDMDICFIYLDNKSKKLVENKFSAVNIDLKQKFGISIAPIYFSRIDFIRELKNDKPLALNIINEGKILCGKSIKELLNG